MSSICDDISEFLDVLKKMRLVDDKIVHSLNTTIPTESFSAKVDAHATCKDLFMQIVQAHKSRNQSLEQCLSTTTVAVQKLKEERNAKPDDGRLLQKLRREQTKLRELQIQINVEEVVRERTMKIYNERCRSYYKPSQEELF